MSIDQSSLPRAFHLGLRAYNERAFYEAHEHFEDAWRNTTGEAREFFRAFLHLSGGFYRLTQNRPQAARKFFSHALKWLALFPVRHHGFDVSRIIEDTTQWINAIDKEIPSNVILKDQFQTIRPGKGWKQ